MGGQGKELQKAGGRAGRSKKHGTDLLLLPEMSFTGFSMRTELTKEYNEESKDRIKRFAKTIKSALVSAG